MNQYQELVVNKAKELGLSTEHLSPVKYNYLQMLEIFSCLLAGIDPKSLASPELSEDEMSEIKDALFLANNFVENKTYDTLLDSVCPDRKFMQEMLVQLNSMQTDMTTVHAGLSSSDLATRAYLAVEIGEDLFDKLQIVIDLQRGCAQVTAGTYVYTYGIRENEEFYILSALASTSLKVRKQAKRLRVIR